MVFIGKLLLWMSLFYLGYRSAQKGRQFPKINPRLILLILVVVYSGVYYFWNWNRHASFRTYAFDLSVMMQALTNFRLASAIAGGSLFGDHFSPVLLLVTPFFQIFPNLYLLFGLQALLLALPAIPLYRIARKLGLEDWPALLVVFVYQNFYCTWQLVLTDFHAEIFMPLLLLLLIDAYLHREQVLYWFFMMVSLGIKEDIGFYLFAAALLLLPFQRERWRTLLVTAMAALVVGMFSVMFLMSNHQGVYNYFSYWSEYGKGILGILIGMVTHPLQSFSILFAFSSLKFNFSLALLPLFSIWGLAGLPILWLQLASNQEVQANLGLYYSAPVLAFAFTALAGGWARLHTWLKDSPGQRTWLWGVACFLVVVNLPETKLFTITPAEQALNSLLHQLPAQSQVLAQADLAPHFPNQDRVRVLGIKPEEDFQPEFVVFHYQGSIWPFDQDHYLQILKDFRLDPQYRVFKEAFGAVVFQRRKE